MDAWRPMVVVTSAASGIGLAIATALAKVGSQQTSTAALEAAAAPLWSSGAVVDTLVLDAIVTNRRYVLTDGFGADTLELRFEAILEAAGSERTSSSPTSAEPLPASPKN